MGACSALAEYRILSTEHFISGRVRILPSLACGVLVLGWLPTLIAGSVSLTWDEPHDPSVLAYFVHYGAASGRYTTSVLVPSGTSTTISNLDDGVMYYFAVTSFDIFGLESDYSDEVSWFVPLPVTILRNGSGTVYVEEMTAPNPSQRLYRLTAIPSKGMVFAGWTGSIPATDATLSFVWTSNVIAVANFVPSPYPSIQGSYVGLFSETPNARLTSSGDFNIAVTSRGSYSGRLQLGSARLFFTGHLSAQCDGVTQIPRTNDTPLVLAFNLGTGNSADQISGTLSDGNWVADLAGERAVFNATTNPATCAGSYTVVFPGVGADPSLPAGDGFGTVRIFRSGLLAFSCTLADGARITHTATVSKSSRWPLRVSPYGGNGLFIGWPSFGNLTGRTELPQGIWIKPANPFAQYYAGGFTNQIGIQASPYTAPPKNNGKLLSFGQSTISFSGGNLAAEFSNTLTVGPYGRTRNWSSNSLTLIFSLGNGTFRGSVLDPSSGQRFPFSGAVLQNLDTARGFALGSDASSRVTLLAK